MCQGLLRLVILNICVVLMEVKIIYLGEKTKVSPEVALNLLWNVDVWECTVFTVVVGS